MKKIHKNFYSEKDGELLKTCVFCNDNVLEYEYGYVIEKAFKFNKVTNIFELVFEYALCTECMQRLSSEMSEESKNNITEYFNRNKKQEYFSVLTVEERFKMCMLSGKNLKTQKEYQIAGFFIKDEMIVSNDFPFAIGFDAIEEVQELISDQTRDFSDKFKDVVLPPHVKDNFPKDRILIF